MTTPKQHARTKTLTDEVIVKLEKSPAASLTRSTIEKWLACSSVEASRVVTELQKRNKLSRAQRPLELYDSASRENWYRVKK